MNNTPPKPDLTIKEVVALTLLGIDWGERRMGVAIKPAGQDWPIPKEILHVRGEDEAVAALRRVIAASGAGAVVVGLPIHSLVDPLHFMGHVQAVEILEPVQGRGVDPAAIAVTSGPIGAADVSIDVRGARVLVVRV